MSGFPTESSLMFTFSHITSIGLSQEEYAKRLAAGEKNLVKGENKWYREVATELTIALTIDELSDLENDAPNVEIKLGEKKFQVPPCIKDYIVGAKLRVNQMVQARERDGGIEWKSILAKVIRETKDETERAAALNALIGKASAGKAFAEKWLSENGEAAE